MENLSIKHFNDGHIIVDFSTRYLPHLREGFCGETAQVISDIENQYETYKKQYDALTENDSIKKSLAWGLEDFSAVLNLLYACCK